jgi:predicted CxxxxCH...CXXCH cytochrome family protein
MSPVLLVLLSGCGDRWSPGAPPHSEAFLLECQHEAASCEACHPAEQPLGSLDPACISCHEAQRPASHDPATTTSCEDCHEGSCGWQSASPHPQGFSEPAVHGLEAKLQGPAEGDCRECHGAELSDCDDCHAEQSHPDWRSDCVFCHGGTDDPTGGPTGAPPRDLDGAVDPSALSFRAHTAHVDDDGDYRVQGCDQCHAFLYQDALEPEHWFDATPAAAEARFERGLAEATAWDGQDTCGTSYCHGQGQRDDGTVSDEHGPMDCESCHRTEGGWDSMSGLHSAHLAEDGIVCNDCHAAVIDRQGGIDGPGRHVDGVRDISFYETTIDSADGGGTCTGPCHGQQHDGLGWGHVPDYDLPELHGLDSNTQSSDCGACHGADWTGGVGQGCDDCHADEGHSGWRSDCTFCHGGSLDTSGAPPQDLDSTSAEQDISFGAHPEHTGAGTGSVGHPDYGCEQCHLLTADPLAPGHALDPSAGRAEVDLSGGTSAEGGYDPGSQTCSNLYCHGNGQTPSGTISDGDTPRDCDSCHRTSDPSALSGTHAAHLAVSGVSCADCHEPVVDAAQQIATPALHVDRTVQLAPGSGWSQAERTCTLTCHEQDHQAFGWAGPHPQGFDAPEAHGQEALLRLQDCTDCHGADLDGGSAQGCDGCHTAGWRSDCVYCHGSPPPQDLDNTADAAAISFMGHAEHMESDTHPAQTCQTCHAGAQSYADAFGDPDHWIDSTPAVAEVSFTGLGSGTRYASNTCSDSYCHGNGQVNGAQVDSATSLDCDSCHSYRFDRGDLSGTHALHLGVTGVTCADCHGDGVDAAGTLTLPARHVDGVVDVDDADTVWNSTSSTCTGTCHDQAHDALAWTGGHPPGYDDPLVHGQDALLGASDCATSGCHGTDLSGGASGQGCDSCHTIGWRSDCLFCHGGPPPQDLDNTTNEAAISFMAHPEHTDGDTHPLWGCETCHGAGSASYSDALTDVGHWMDATLGVSEVSFTGLGAGGTYTTSTSTCAEVYCHSTGYYDTLLAGFYFMDDVVDSNSALGCDSCHLAPPDSVTGTEEHRKHKHNQVSCDWCHDSVASSSSTIRGSDLHVDGLYQVVYSADADQWGGMSYDAGTMRCNGECHAGGDSKDHENKTWK